LRTPEEILENMTELDKESATLLKSVQKLL
jgi:hypothetical protein